ncbi:MAG: 1-acyl-sn-glycerol-3-phosphate acyltransferase [Clostridium sp.]|nr:1-acyl-sn-glycerol-3-phosphate acyltransferase [Clostridium sp.]
MNFLFIKGIIYQLFKFISLIPTYNKFKNNPNKYSLEDKYKVVQAYVNKSLRLAKIKVNVSGYENLPEGNVLFVSNHSNWGDAFILMSVVDRPCGMVVAKEANWDKVPLISGWLDMINCLHLDRSNNRNALKTMQEGENILKEKCSLGIFPEGFVTKSDTLASFKDGAFRMALKAQVPIVPIYIKNSKGIFEMTSRWTGKLYPTQIDVQILEPIYNHIDNPKVKTKEISNLVRNNMINYINNNKKL